MTKMEITITEGLTKLKTLTKRINKLTNSIQYCEVSQNGKAPNGYKTVDEYMSDVKAKYQELQDLITLKKAIKAAIVMANATKKVTIAGKEMTIAEAIDFKNQIPVYEELLASMTRSLTLANNKVLHNTQLMEDKLSRLVDSATQNQKIDSAKLEALKATLEIKIEYLDPLGIKKEIERLDNEISIFNEECDLRLSIADSQTMIEVVF